MISLNDTSYHFILASQSPRRQFLLKETGLKFEVMVRPTSEDFPSHMQCEAIAEHICRIKAEEFDFASLPADSLIIAADTIVWAQNSYIGKPTGRDDAIRMLSKLSGRKHTVATGICLRTATAEKIFSAITDVYFRPLLPGEIEFYVDTFKPYDKAGAYAIQEWIGYIGIERIDGCYYNVMGLPVQKLIAELKAFTGV